MSQPIVTLTTDFGQADGYVGTMKGVILGICPEAALVDISHEIRPQAVQQAAYVLCSAAPYFPPGTVHLAVVDPGVGGKRHPIAVQTQRAIYVAPDNGVLSMVLSQDPPLAAVCIRVKRSPNGLPAISATFHGRDIFAPAAAHLACGTDLHDLGDALPFSDLSILPILQPYPQPKGAWLGKILHVDRFGNLITNIQSADSGRQISITVGGKQITGLKRTYADVEPGELVAYIGSSGYLEIAVRDGNAAAQLSMDVGDSVQIEGQV